MRPSLLLVVGVLALTACTTQGPGSAQQSSPAGHGETAGTTGVAWASCPEDYFASDHADGFDAASVQCATLAVPARYDEPHALPDFGIAMMRLPATDSGARRGTLFINPGGPGESGIEELQQQDFPSEIRRTYDIVGFDPRGVSHSQPVSGGQIRCSDRLDFASYWAGEATPDNLAQVRQQLALGKKYLADCVKHSPAWWTLGTANVVRDLERMRSRVTGDEPLNFLGSSYGTTIAAAYVRAYPKRVGHVVLDSPTDNSADTDASAVTQARSMEKQVIRLVDGYAKARDMTRAQVETAMLHIRDWGDDNRLMGYLGLKRYPGKPGQRLSNEYVYVHGILALTYLDHDDAQQAFNAGIDALLKQRWNGLFEYFSFTLDGYDTQAVYDAYQNGEPYDRDGWTRNNSFEVMEMVNGIDRDQRDLSTPAAQRALGARVRAAAPFLWKLQHDGTDFTYTVKKPGNPWSWLAVEDPKIPDPPRRPTPRVNRSGHPVLVIGSRHESTTPYPFAVKTAKDLKSVLVTWEGTEHAPLAGFEHMCLNDVFVHYLLYDELPDKPVSCTI